MIQPAKCIDQTAVARRIDQSAFVMLTVNLDKARAHAAQLAGTYRTIIDKSAGPAI